MAMPRRHFPVYVALGGVLLLAWGAHALGAEAEDCRNRTVTGNAGIAACTTAIATAEGAEKARLLMERARLLRQGSNFPEAEADLDKAMMLAPDNADLLVELGYLRHAQGDPEGQLAADAKALSIDPRNWRALLNHMDALASLGRNENCLLEGPRAVELAPDQPYTYAYRGRCRAGIGQSAEAVDDYEKALGLGLDEAFLHANLALARLDLGRDREALEAAQTAIERDPANAYGHYGKVDALLQLGRTDAAITAYREALAAMGEDRLGLANLLAWALYRQGRATDALAIIEEFFDAHPRPGTDQAYEVDTYAHILSALGEEEKAVRQFLLAADLGGAARQEDYRRQLRLMGMTVADGRDGLAAALTQCVKKGADCRLSP